MKKGFDRIIPTQNGFFLINKKNAIWLTEAPEELKPPGFSIKTTFLVFLIGWNTK
jgi:hypothetical protein